MPAYESGIPQARAHAPGTASKPLSVRLNPGNVGVRMFGGRVNNVKALASGGSNGRTYEVVTTTAVPFDAIRIITAFGQTVGADAITPVLWCNAKSVPDLTDASIAVDAGWTSVNFGGPGGIGGAYNPNMAPASTNGRRVLTISDVMPVMSVPRTDGGAYPAIAIRCYVHTNGAAGNYVIQGDGAQSFANWENHPSGRIWRMREKGGQFAAAGQSGMAYANSAVSNGSPIVGIIYYARGKVVNIGGFGDSITEGQGTYIGEGFGLPACQELSKNDAGIPFEWSNLGWSGASATTIRQNAIDTMAAFGAAGVKLDIGLLPGATPNDVTGAITEANIAAMRFRMSHTLDLIKQAGILPILWTWLPTNTAIKNYGSSDSLRRGLNDDYRAWASRGGIIVDFDKALAGAVVNEQVQMLAGTTTDNIHPNDAGNALLATALTRALRATTSVSPGALTIP